MVFVQGRWEDELYVLPVPCPGESDILGFNQPIVGSCKLQFVEVTISNCIVVKNSLEEKRDKLEVVLVNQEKSVSLRDRHLPGSQITIGFGTKVSNVVSISII